MLRKNNTTLPVFLRIKLISPPKSPSNEASAFLAKSTNQLAILANCFLTLSAKVFLFDCVGVSVVVVGITARKTVDIIIPTEVIEAAIVSPSRLNNFRNLSERWLV